MGSSNLTNDHAHVKAVYRDKLKAGLPAHGKEEASEEGGGTSTSTTSRKRSRYRPELHTRTVTTTSGKRIEGREYTGPITASTSAWKLRYQRSSSIWTVSRCRAVRPVSLLPHERGTGGASNRRPGSAPEASSRPSTSGAAQRHGPGEEPHLPKGTRRLQQRSRTQEGVDDRDRKLREKPHPLRFLRYFLMARYTDELVREDGIWLSGSFRTKGKRWL